MHYIRYLFYRRYLSLRYPTLAFQSLPSLREILALHVSNFECVFIVTRCYSCIKYHLVLPNSNITPRRASWSNLYVSSKDIGIDSTLSFLHEGHMSTILCISLRYVAHQKHDLHIKKFLSLKVITCCSEYGFFKPIMTLFSPFFFYRNMLEYKTPEYTAIW